MSKNNKSGLGKFIAGALIGAGIGILFAPKKGSETRADLKNKFDELVEKAKNLKASDVKDYIEEKVEQAGATLEGMGFLIEKGFQEGGKELRRRGIHVESLAIIDSLDNCTITIR